MGDNRQRDPGLNGDTVSNIQIEDPLNFLDASEKEAYIRERNRREEEKLERRVRKEKELSAAARSLPEEERARIKRETNDPLSYAKHETPDRRKRPAPRREEPEEDDWEDEEEEEDEDESRGILIAAGILGILIVLVLVFMGWMVFFMPGGGAEPEAEERALAEAQMEEPDDTSAELSADESEDEPADTGIGLPDGFEEREDTVVTTTALNMRSTPDSSSDNNKVTSVQAGTALSRVGEDPVTGWCAVRVPGFDGILYCSGKYLETQ